MGSSLRVTVFQLSPLQSNCYIVSHGREALVIDPGWPEGVDRILDYVDSAGYRIGLIVATHGHFDHVMGVDAVKEATGAKFAIHHLDVELINRSARIARELLGLNAKPPEPDDTLTEGETITVGGERLEVIHTPGHTRGSIVLAGHRIAFTGDTIFKGTIGRVDLPESSPEDMERSLAKILRLHPKTTLYPG
nr:MBL fold metallo-hydrolase [Desulfurococcales archaeon]